jgi:hypothetical protein
MISPWLKALMHSPLFVVDFNQAIISKPKSMLVQSQITF